MLVAPMVLRTMPGSAIIRDCVPHPFGAAVAARRRSATAAGCLVSHSAISPKLCSSLQWSCGPCRGARLFGTASLTPSGPPSLRVGVLRKPLAVLSATRPSFQNLVSPQRALQNIPGSAYWGLIPSSLGGNNDWLRPLSRPNYRFLP